MQSVIACAPVWNSTAVDSIAYVVRRARHADARNNLSNQRAAKLATNHEPMRAGLRARPLECRDSPAWRLLSGTQDEIGQCLAKYFDRCGVRRLDDFGGVCETFLYNNDVYVDSPPRVKPGAAVFSFTPRKRVLAEASQMARVCTRAGYSLLILTVQKHDKFGKVWVLRAALRHLKVDSLTYYEDTNSIIDELKASPEGKRVVAVHVQVP